MIVRAITLAHPADLDGWRTHARALAQAGIPANQVAWRVEGESADLLATAAPPAPLPDAADSPFNVPRAFLDLARAVVCHTAPERFALLYAVLLRLLANRRLLADSADPHVHRLNVMAQAVRRDIHKMRAFVRFRAVADGEAERFVAWFEPDHHIVRLNAPFFVRRFAAMHWSILIPAQCAHWDGEALTFTPGATRETAPDGDELEATWKTYYAAIFNPARLKVGAMLREMPKKYWRNMPETALVRELIAQAETRERAMIAASPPHPAPESGSSLPLPPAGEGMLASASGGEGSLSALAALATEAHACTRCPLHAPATQTVFGEGPADAALMLVGEQPGDQEDIAGRPFVGPAGQVLDRALAAANIDRARTYITNAVKHFKFEPRGKRRIHARPGTSEIEACRWWLDQERTLVRPRLTVALGATAARALTGRTVTIARERGRPFALPDGSTGFITVHPSYLLRIEDPAAAEAEFARFVEDLAAARALALAAA